MSFHWQKPGRENILKKEGRIKISQNFVGAIAPMCAHYAPPLEEDIHKISNQNIALSSVRKTNHEEPFCKVWCSLSDYKQISPFNRTYNLMKNCFNLSFLLSGTLIILCRWWTFSYSSHVLKCNLLKLRIRIFPNIRILFFYFVLIYSLYWFLQNIQYFMVVFLKNCWAPMSS